MRALNLVGFLALSLIAAGCGGDSSSRNPNGNEGGSQDPGDNDAGESSGNEAGAGNGAGGTTTGTGGNATGASPSRGGTGGGTSPPSKAGAGGGIGVGGATPIPPTGGTSGGGPIEPPKGCESAGATPPSFGYCDAYFVCDGSNYYKLNCYDMGTGSSYCQCSDNTGSRSFELAGTTTNATCTTAAEICRNGLPPAPDPSECMPRLESRSSTYCQMEQICNQELDSGATVSTILGINCSDDGTGRMLCSCYPQQNTTAIYQYYVEGQNGTTACDTVFEYCDDTVTNPSFEPIGECRPQAQSGGTGYCEVQSTCLLGDEIADGIYVAQQTYLQASCSSGTTGPSTCSCFNGSGSFTVERNEPVSGIAACTAISEICGKVSGVKPDGEVVCENVSQQAVGNSCYMALDCSASATIDGIEIDLHGGIALNCNGQPGSWSCSCSSGSSYATVTANDNSAWDACTSGMEACRDAVDVQFGGGGGIGMPVPGGRPGIPF